MVVRGLCKRFSDIKKYGGAYSDCDDNQGLQVCAMGFSLISNDVQ